MTYKIITLFIGLISVLAPTSALAVMRTGNFSSNTLQPAPTEIQPNVSQNVNATGTAIVPTALEPIAENQTNDRSKSEQTKQTKNYTPANTPEASKVYTDLWIIISLLVLGAIFYLVQKLTKKN